MSRFRKPHPNQPPAGSPILTPDMERRVGAAPVINLFGIAGPGGEGTITTLDQLLHGAVNHLGTTILVAAMLGRLESPMELGDPQREAMAQEARDIMEAILEELQRVPEKEGPDGQDVEKGPQDVKKPVT